MNLADIFTLSYGRPMLQVNIEKEPLEVVLHWPRGEWLQMRFGPRKVIHFEGIVSAGREERTGFYTTLCRTVAPMLADAGVPCITCEPADEEAARILKGRGKWQPLGASDELWIWWLRSESEEAYLAAAALTAAVRLERNGQTRS